jgi:hypothetical protein
MKVSMELSSDEDIKRYKEETTTIFLHIPKSAGQTLFQILNREYKHANIYTFQGGRQRLANSIKEFENLPIAERNKYRLLRGHVKFGIHRLIERPFTYITILRDPVSRILSHYHYVLRTPAHALHELVTSTGMDIVRYVSSGLSTELNNGQVRLIAGTGSDLPFGQCSEALLQEAIKNLETSFSVVGLTERFDDTILLMNQTLGWHKFPYYTKRNVTKGRGYGMELSAEAIEAIRKYNALDLRLYEYAARQFEQAAKRIPDRMRRRFHLLNAIYYPYGRTASKVNGWLQALYKNYQK